MRSAIVIAGCLLALAVLAATQSQFFSGDVIVAGVVRDPGGTHYIKDAPPTGGIYGRGTNAWVVVPAGGGGGISHGPSDGLARGSRNGYWDIIDTSDLANFSAWAEGFVVQSSAAGGRSELGLGNAATRNVGTGSGDVAAGDHGHAYSSLTGLPDLSVYATNGHTHAAADVTSGVFPASRLGTGTPSSSVFLRGDGTWATVTVDPGNTNGLTDAPNDGTFYGRKSGGWVQPTPADLSGVTSFGEAFLGLIDEVDALDHLGLIGSGPATIDSPAKYAVRINSGGSPSTRHRLNLIAGTGISLALTDDAGNDESDLTVSLGSHTHAISEVTGLQSALDAKSDVGHTHPDLANFVFLTVSAVLDENQDTTYRSVMGTVKSGYSSTLPANSLSAGSVIKVEAAGVLTADDAHTPDVQLRIGSSLTLHWDVTEPYSTGPTEGTPWNLTAWITVTTAGSSASVIVNGWMDYADNTGGWAGIYAPSPLIRSKALVSGTLNTTVGNAIDLVYRANDTATDSFSCTHFILQQF